MSLLSHKRLPSHSQPQHDHCHWAEECHRCHWLSSTNLCCDLCMITMSIGDVTLLSFRGLFVKSKITHVWSEISDVVHTEYCIRALAQRKTLPNFQIVSTYLKKEAAGSGSCLFRHEFRHQVLTNVPALILRTSHPKTPLLPPIYFALVRCKEGRELYFGVIPEEPITLCSCWKFRDLLSSWQRIQ